MHDDGEGTKPEDSRDDVERRVMPFPGGLVSRLRLGSRRLDGVKGWATRRRGLWVVHDDANPKDGQ